ncbi:ribonuclease H protein [Canna indica]|uniref:Ribonuclease H protein n=1 Tax=Canna indica TaxID=4628 RepID=A0AAQ3QJM1_9LILI|nr:ribonuclease H protein [Canna indica]
MATTWISGSTIQKYESIAKKYLWSHGTINKGMHLIGWKSVTASRSVGGLGIKDLGLHEAIQTLREGLRMKVSTGDGIDLLKDPWVSNIPILKWSTYINMDLQLKYQKFRSSWIDGDWMKDAIKASKIKKAIVGEKMNILNDILQKGDSSYVILSDTAWKSKEENAGLGVCILDMNGNTIAQAHYVKCVNSPLEAEPWTIWAGILKAMDLKINDIVILSDCLKAINILNRKDKPPWFLHILI